MQGKQCNRVGTCKMNNKNNNKKLTKDDDSRNQQKHQSQTQVLLVPDDVVLHWLLVLVLSHLQKEGAFELIDVAMVLVMNGV